MPRPTERPPAGVPKPKTQAISCGLPHSGAAEAGACTEPAYGAYMVQVRPGLMTGSEPTTTMVLVLCQRAFEAVSALYQKVAPADHG